MDIKENVSLKSYSTMRLGGQARWLAEAYEENDIPNLVEWAKHQNVPFMVIGSGSNIVWRDEGFNGLIIVNKILGKQILSEDEAGATVHIASGEIWDDAVGWTVEKGLSGIEFLSLIPGTAGAAPVQNIGAYGAELSNILTEVGVYDDETNAFGSIIASQCGFDYRTSRFKQADKGRFIITNITLKLSKKSPGPPFYDSLKNYLNEHKISEFNSKVIRNAVINIRSSKLPDPAEIANNGSFFTNPFVEQSQFDSLKQKYPEIKGWPAKDGKIKLAAGWLVEQAGFKGVHDDETGISTWPTQALVLVNEHAKTTADLLSFKQKIVDKVREMFGITLEQEPELLP
ncbi:UDP-N-acetylmuramate dehydrogenase [Candidatus Saccharibacteria bacterium]|nr:UDP-N-acetylmuramate dehydrogenase [Candidatus Saccharibacteria bacterium]